MKYLLLSMFLALNAIGIKAQDCVIPMGVFVDSDRLPDASAKSLHNKLSKVITSDGIEGGNYSLFYIIASLEEVQEEAISGLRPTYLKVFNLNLSVGNLQTGEKFNNTSIELRGSGSSQERAFNAAFAKLNNNPEIARLVSSAKSKIISYYDSQMNSILAKVKSLTSTKQYEEALCLLSSVPTCCSKYPLVEKELASTFQQYVNYDCAEKILRARAIWAASQTTESAIMAGAYLSAISPSASCSDEAVNLLSQIQTRMGDEWDLHKELVRGSMNLELERIHAARAIGVAYGQNQKANTYNDHWIVR